MTRSPYPIRRPRQERRRLISTGGVSLIVSNSPEDEPDRISRLEVSVIRPEYQPLNAAIRLQINKTDSSHTTIFIHSTTCRELVPAATITAPRAVASGEERTAGWRRSVMISLSPGVRFSETAARDMIHPTSRPKGREIISFSCRPEPDSGEANADPGHVGVVARTLNTDISGIPVDSIWQTC